MVIPNRILLLTMLALAGAATSALAQASSPASQPSAAPKEEEAEPDPLRFGNDDVFLELAPFLQLDGGFANASPDAFVDDDDVTSGNVRRGRLYADFGIYDFGGRLAVDFKTLEETPIIYAYVNYAVTDALKLQAGQQDIPFSLQDLTGSRSASFNEDGQNSGLQPGDAVGLAALYGGEAFSLSAGVFGGDINAQPFEDEGTTAAARATYAPIAEDDRAIHLGFALLGTFDPETALSFSGDFGSNLVEASAISTGDFEDVETYVAGNLELAAASGRYTFQSEYTLGEIDDRLRGTATLGGGYASVLAFLTDDHRKYDAAAGVFERIEPSRPITEGGGGALEFGARFDYLDLSDAGPDAGTEIAGTGIVNWYLTDEVRLSGSHTYTAVTDGPDEDAEVNATLVRFWFVY